jgi:alpha-tubulin suppressor-like RCC1 family protein
MKFIDVSARRSCSAAVTSDGKLFTWGNGRNGMLGQDSSNVNILVPKEVPVNDTFKQVSCGYQHMCAVTTNGEVYVWGNVDDSAGKFRVIGTKEQDRKNSNRKARKVEKLSGIKEVACSA